MYKRQNNFSDMFASLEILNSLKKNSGTVIIKHANPCGFAIGDNTVEAFERAVSSDPVSYFGGIVGFNSIVDSELAEILVKPFLECIVAPDFDEQSLEIFKSKKNLRLIKTSKGFTLSNKMIKNALGGYLIQDRDQLSFEGAKILLSHPIKVLSLRLNLSRLSKSFTS